MLVDAAVTISIVTLVALCGRNAALALDPRQGPERWLVGSVMGVTSLLVACMAAGVTGLLNTVPVVLVLGAGAAASCVAVRRIRRPMRIDEPPLVSEPKWVAALAYVGVALTAIVWASGFQKVLTRGVVDIDSHHYHLTHALRFAQTGEILPVVHVWDGDLAAYHPLNDELIRALGFAVGKSDLVGQFWSAAVIAIGILAAYCLGRRAGRPATSVLLAVGAMSMPGAVLPFAGGAANDLSALAMLMAAVTLSWGARTRGSWFVVGCAAGVSLGTKLTVVPAVVTLLVVLCVMLARRGRAATSLWMVSGSMLTGSLWYVRNWAVSGNPIPGLDLPLGPLSLNEPTAPTLERVSHSVLEYAGDPKVIRNYFLPGLLDSFGVVWPVVLLLAIVGVMAGLAVLRRRPDLLGQASRDVAVLCAAVAIVAGGGYLLTPTSANGPQGDPYLFGPNLRYLLPATVPGAWAALIVLPRRWSAPLAAAASVSGLAAAATSIAGFYGWRHVLVGLIAAWIMASALWLVSRRAMLEAIVLASISLGAGMAAGPLRGPYLDRQYHSPSQQGPLFLAVADAPRGSSIAVLGVPYSYGYAGRDLQNRVTYVGETTTDDGYGSYRSCRRLVSALKASSYDYVAVNRGPQGRAPVPKEFKWVSNLDGLKLVQSTPDGGWVYQTVGPLDPDDC